MKRDLNIRYWFTVAILIIGGFILIFLSQKITFPLWKSTINEAASAILIAGIFSLINEKFLKESLIDLVLSKVNLKNHLDSKGIKEIHTNISNVNYKQMIQETKHNIDIVHIYGRTWTNTYYDDLKDKLKNSKCKIRIILLNPNSKYVSAIAEYYGISETEMAKRINDSLTQLVKLQSIKKSLVQIYVHTGNPAACIYRFDNTLVTIQNKLSKEKCKSLPVIICKKNDSPESYYNTIISDIEDLIRESILFIPST